LFSNIILYKILMHFLIILLFNFYFIISLKIIN